MCNSLMKHISRNAYKIIIIITIVVVVVLLLVVVVVVEVIKFIMSFIKE